MEIERNEMINERTPSISCSAVQLDKHIFFSVSSSGLCIFRTHTHTHCERTMCGADDDVVDSYDFSISLWCSWCVLGLAKNFRTNEHLVDF